MPRCAPRCGVPSAGQPVVLLKGGEGVTLDFAAANVNLNAVLYKKQLAAVGQSGSGGSLSVGAIVGIAVGAACAAAAFLVLAVLLVRRRRRRPAEVCGAGETMKVGCYFCLPCVTQLADAQRGHALACCSCVQPNNSGISDAASSEQNVGCTLTDGWAYGGGGSALAVLQPSAPGAECALATAPAAATRCGEPSEHATASGDSSLPLGDPGSVPTPRANKARLANCPAPPPPSESSSLAPELPATGLSIHVALHARLPPQGPTGHQGPPRPATSPHPLLSHLPTFGWQRCVVDYQAIEFVVGPDGKPQELGVGASATVRSRGVARCLLVLASKCICVRRS